MRVMITNEAYRLADKIPFQEPEKLENLTAARGQEAAFQIILFPEENCDLCLEAEPRIYGGIGYPAYRLEVCSAYTPTVWAEGMLCDDEGIKRADILLSDRKIGMKSGRPFAVWAQLTVPEEAQKKDSEVTVRIWKTEGNKDEKPVFKKSFPLQVRSYKMPRPSQYRFRLDLWQHVSNVARQFGVPLFGEEHFRVLEEMVKSLAELGQKSVTVVASDSPWRGWKCWENSKAPATLYEYSMVRTTKKPDGSYCYDYCAMQRYIDLCGKYGINGEIEVFGLVNIWREASFDQMELCPDYPENILIRYYDEAQGSFGYLRNAEDICAYISGLEQYFIKTGQIDRVRVAADEPGDFERYRKSLDIVRKTAPAFRYKTAFDHAEFLDHCEEGITDYAPNFYCACSQYERLKKMQKERPDSRLQWYICCGPGYPNTFLKSDLLEARFLGIMNALLGFDGLLRWTYTCWTDQPLEDIRYGNWRAGDLCLVYPAKNGGILKSLRWKALKRGIEDYELLERIRELGREDVIEQIFHLLLREENVSNYILEDWEVLSDIFVNDYSVFEQARQIMLNTLEGMQE